MQNKKEQQQKKTTKNKNNNKDLTNTMIYVLKRDYAALSCSGLVYSRTCHVVVFSMGKTRSMK
jgi:hypothetical protein